MIAGAALKQAQQASQAAWLADLRRLLDDGDQYFADLCWRDDNTGDYIHGHKGTLSYAENACPLIRSLYSHTVCSRQRCVSSEIPKFRWQYTSTRDHVEVDVGLAVDDSWGRVDVHEKKPVPVMSHTAVNRRSTRFRHDACGEPHYACSITRYRSICASRFPRLSVHCVAADQRRHLLPVRRRCQSSRGQHHRDRALSAGEWRIYCHPAELSEIYALSRICFLHGAVGCLQMFKYGWK